MFKWVNDVCDFSDAVKKGKFIMFQFAYRRNANGSCISNFNALQAQ